MPADGQIAAAVRKPPDRRAARTRHAIDRAFIALLQQRGYDAVGVSDIVREADVGRATFYEHYPSKDDLLRSQLRSVLGVTLRPGPGGTVDATALFAHVRDVRVLYRLIAGRSGTARSIRVLQEALENRALELLAHEHRGDGVRMPAAAAARVCAASLSALLSWWTEQGMTATVEEMQSMFAACGAGFGGALAPPTGIEPVSSA